MLQAFCRILSTAMQYQFQTLAREPSATPARSFRPWSLMELIVLISILPNLSEILYNRLFEFALTLKDADEVFEYLTYRTQRLKKHSLRPYRLAA